MRITDNMRSNTTVSNLFNTQSQYNDLMEKIATQKKVNRTSDDPIAAMKINDIRQGIAANEQYQKNIADSNAWISMTESTLSCAYDLLSKAKDIAVSQASGTATAAERTINSQLVQSLIDQLATLANTKLGDRYLFSGSKNGAAPFSTTFGEARIEVAEKAGDNVFEGTALSSGTYSGKTNKTYALKITNTGSLAAATAQVSTDGGKTWKNTTADGIDLSVAGAMAGAGGIINLGDGVDLTFDDDGGAKPFGKNDIFVVNAVADGFYQGNNDQLSLTISRGVSLAYNITGAQAFTASGGTGVDVFKALNDLRVALENNDGQAISDQLENLQNAQEQVLIKQSLCGTMANHIEMAKNSLINLDDKLKSLLSDAQDADLAEYAVRLSLQETALQASYALASKLGNTTILNFLK
jgi:flagellar hook-associated protein 3 FlgL